MMIILIFRDDLIIYVQLIISISSNWTSIKHLRSGERYKVQVSDILKISELIYNIWNNNNYFPHLQSEPQSWVA